MEENQESKTLTQKVREREEQEKLAKRKVLKKIYIVTNRPNNEIYFYK